MNRRNSNCLEHVTLGCSVVLFNNWCRRYLSEDTAEDCVKFCLDLICHKIIWRLVLAFVHCVCFWRYMVFTGSTMTACVQFENMLIM